MEYGLADLEKAIQHLEALLESDALAPFKMKLEFPLLQIDTALKKLISMQTSSADNHTKYLLYKQLETNITEIQTNVKINSDDHAEVRTVAQSVEIAALTEAKPFLVAQQKEWLPYYLEHNLQMSFDGENADNKRKITNLCSNIKNITANAQLNSEQKTQKIDEEILKFAENKRSSFGVFTPKDPLQSKVMEWLAIHRLAIINPLLNMGLKPQGLKNQ